MKKWEQYFSANKDAWNKRTAVHKDSFFYDLEGFKKGKSSLNAIERKDLGDVSGKKLLHLQFHFGLDTMSWEREGAIVTGVDISEDAITLARSVAEETKLNARFVCANIYDLANPAIIAAHESLVEGSFDIVFTSYGTIGWLPDLQQWAAIIARYLKPGGLFYMADFHPVLWMMDTRFEKIAYDYFNTSVIEEETSGTYTDRNAPIHYKEYAWNHSFSEIITALLGQQLQLEQFTEYPFSPYNCFNNLEQGPDGYWRIKDMQERMPMLYVIRARKAA